MSVGFNVTKPGIHYALGTGNGADFHLSDVQRLTFSLSSPKDVKDLYDRCRILVQELAKQNRQTQFFILDKAAGKYGSKIPTIQAHTALELAILHEGYEIIPVSPSSLPKKLGCSKGQSWQKQSKALFNSDSKWRYWSEGSDGAAAACYVGSE